MAASGAPARTVSGCLLLTSLAMFLIAVLDEERRFHIARRLGLADLSKLNDTPARASTVSCESKGTARSKDPRRRHAFRAL